MKPSTTDGRVAELDRLRRNHTELLRRANAPGVDEALRSRLIRRASRLDTRIVELGGAGQDDRERRPENGWVRD